MNQDIILIGAGIIGLATAEYFLERGARVSILERNKVGQESSWAGGGILSPLYPWDYSDAVTRLASYSATLFPAWTRALYKATEIDSEYVACGMLVLPPYAVQDARYWCSKHDVKIEELLLPDRSTTGINTDSIRQQGLYLPDIAQVRNPRLIQALLNRVIQLGGEILEDCAVTDITVKHGQVQSLTSMHGQFRADHYVVTSGAWSKEVLGQYAINLDIKPMRGQMLLMKFSTPPIHTILVKKDLYIIPRQDGHLLIGSTLEDVGFDKRTTTIARDDLLTRAQAILPFLRTAPIVKQWAGLRPASPDNIPTIGRHPVIQNLYINSGHFRYGVTMAPASAEILFNELTGNLQPFDTTPYQIGWNAESRLG